MIASGTGVLYTLALGLGRGRRAALWTALGCTIGIVPHLVAATLCLAAILHTSATLFNIVKFAGVACLLCLASSAHKSGGALRVQPSTNPEPGLAIAKRGALLNILNPKLSIYFLSLLTPFLSRHPATVTLEILTLGSLFMAMTFMVFIFYSLFAAQARIHVPGSTRAMAWLNRSFAAIFALPAGRLAPERA